MKKLRVIPSVLMLVACIAVLCVGVFSIKPIENTIGGTINITAAKANVEVSCYINGQQVMAPTKTVGGVDFTIPSEYLNFDVSNVSSASLAPQKILRVRIENKSSEQLGAFFYNSANGLGADGLATFDSLAKELLINNAQGKQVAKATFSPYAHLAPESYVDLYAIIELTTLSDSADSATFAFDINVENYVSNVNYDSAYPGFYDADNYELAKLPLSVETDGMAFSFDFSNLLNTKEMVIPNSTQYTRAPRFYACRALEYILIPQSVIRFRESSFAGGCALKMLQTSTLRVFSETYDDYDDITIYRDVPFPCAFEGDDLSYEVRTPNVSDEMYFHGSIPSSLKTLIINDTTGTKGLFDIAGTSEFESSIISDIYWNGSLENIVLGPNVNTLAYTVPCKKFVIPAGLIANAYNGIRINHYYSYVENLTVGEGVTTLGGSVSITSGNSNLKSFHLPSTLNTLTTNCKKLTALDLLYIPDGVSSWGSGIFDNSTTYSLGGTKIANLSSSQVNIDPDTESIINPANYYFTAFSGASGFNVVFRNGVNYTGGKSFNSITIVSGSIGEEFGASTNLLILGADVTSMSYLSSCYPKSNSSFTIVVKAGSKSITGNLPDTDSDTAYSLVWTKTVNGAVFGASELSRDEIYDTTFTFELGDEI